jgi:phospholipid transport system substrate-binding protein
MLRRSYWLTLSVFIVASSWGSVWGYSAPSPSQFVAGFLDDAFAVCRLTENPVQVREAKLRNLFRAKLDVSLIARLITNDRLTEATPDIQRRFEELLVNYLVQLFYGKIEGATNSSVEIKVEPPFDDGAVVVTTIIGKPGAPSESIKWRLNASTGSFKIVDVISGGISVVSLQREVFLAVMQRGGLPQLITQLEAHAH